MKAQPNNIFVENPEPQAFLPLSKEIQNWKEY